MATSHMSGVIQHLRRVLRDGAGLTDGQLLEDYISRRDEAAFAALVRRHGPMVWGVCRRVLRNRPDAEDAFQATFLVLVRRAASIASRELLANWLYGVAHQTALKARATAAKRKERERQVTEMPEPAVTQQDPWRDLQPVLDEELSRLPENYRGVIVLCDLEGKTRKEVAEQLGCPEGTVASRLARARTMLAKRLAQRGVALSGGTLAAVLSQQAMSAGVPTSVVDSTIKAATLFAAGNAATGVISLNVAALTEGVMKAMFLTKFKPTLAAFLILVAAVVACGVASTGMLGAKSDRDDSERKSQGPAPGFIPAPEGPVPPEAPVLVKAVYFVGKQGGDLSADDLKKYPEVKTVHTFADLQRLAGKKVAVWIDLTALPLFQGDKEREWIIRKGAEEYPFAMVGCNEFLWCFREKLDCFGISGPGPADWTKYELSPGFSVICRHREKVGMELHDTTNGRGYEVVPTVRRLLNVTNRLLAGEAAPETP